MIRTQYEANVFGPIRLIQAVVPTFRERKAGTVINIGSSVSYSGVPGIGVYASTKAALRGKHPRAVLVLEITILMLRPIP